VCTTQLADMTSALRGADPAVRDETGLVFVTVDPKRDDADTIRAYLDRFDPSYVGLRSADRGMLVEAAADLGVAMTGSSDTDVGYEVGHGGQLIGFGPDGTAPVIWQPGTPVADIRADLATLAGQS
jgi:protein SCO1/2